MRCWAVAAQDFCAAASDQRAPKFELAGSSQAYRQRHNEAPRAAPRRLRQLFAGARILGRPCLSASLAAPQASACSGMRIGAGTEPHVGQHHARPASQAGKDCAVVRACSLSLTRLSSATTVGVVPCVGTQQFWPMLGNPRG